MRINDYDSIGDYLGFLLSILVRHILSSVGVHSNGETFIGKKCQLSASISFYLSSHSCAVVAPVVQ